LFYKNFPSVKCQFFLQGIWSDAHNESSKSDVGVNTEIIIKEVSAKNSQKYGNDTNLDTEENNNNEIKTSDDVCTCSDAKIKNSMYSDNNRKPVAIEQATGGNKVSISFIEVDDNIENNILEKAVFVEDNINSEKMKTKTVAPTLATVERSTNTEVLSSDKSENTENISNYNKSTNNESNEYTENDVDSKVRESAEKYVNTEVSKYTEKSMNTNSCEYAEKEVNTEINEHEANSSNIEINKCSTKSEHAAKGVNTDISTFSLNSLNADMREYTEKGSNTDTSRFAVKEVNTEFQDCTSMGSNTEICEYEARGVNTIAIDCKDNEMNTEEDAQKDYETQDELKLPRGGETTERKEKSFLQEEITQVINST
jgi:hypothetical protein